MRLGALHSRDFRLYWIALILSATGTWMQIVAQSLLVLRLSHGSAAPLGWVALAQAAAFFLFALLGGDLADRMDRRRLLLVTNSVLMAVAFVMGLLVALHAIRIWMIVAAAFVSGAALSFDQPARYSFLTGLVDEAELGSAVSLQATVFAGAAAIAPVLAGLSIEHYGLAANFFCNSASYVAVIGAICALRHRAETGVRRPSRLRESLAEGMEAVRRDGILVWALSGYALLLFAAPSLQILLPVLVPRILRGGAGSLGVLLAIFGAGSIGGALLVPWLAGRWRRDRIYLGCFAVWTGAMAVLGGTERMAVYGGALLLLGAAQNAVGTLTITLLQSRVAHRLRGRMMSLQTLLNMGVRPLGDFPMSLLIAAAGARWTAGVSAALIGCCGFVLLGVRGRVWRE